jgi:hypothetical protein
MAKRESVPTPRELRAANPQRRIRSNDECLMCGKPSLRLICALCAGRLKREALRGEIEDEKQGKRPTHLAHT